ncbi:MAG: hypothetical protein HC860_10050 [Alkalinema sp. RU_4_3]|nr:hypothetical protein [Alkalinema sp. RU_4_3]
MGQASKYWTILLLDSAGKSRQRELPSVKTFLESQFPNCLEEDSLLSEDQLVRSLLPCATPEAQLTLRCLISHQIVIACQSLVNQFGQFYGFSIGDLLPLVLDDDGKPWTSQGTYKYWPSRYSIASIQPPENSPPGSPAWCANTPPSAPASSTTVSTSSATGQF